MWKDLQNDNAQFPALLLKRVDEADGDDFIDLGLNSPLLHRTKEIKRRNHPLADVVCLHLQRSRNDRSLVVEGDLYLLLDKRGLILINADAEEVLHHHQGVEGLLHLQTLLLVRVMSPRPLPDPVEEDVG